MPTQPGMNIGYLSFNHTKEPWKSNIELRKAIAHAINRKAIVDNIYQGMGQVAKNPIPPTMWGYNEMIPGFAFDPDTEPTRFNRQTSPCPEQLERRIRCSDYERRRTGTRFQAWKEPLS